MKQAILVAVVVLSAVVPAFDAATFLELPGTCPVKAAESTVDAAVEI